MKYRRVLMVLVCCIGVACIINGLLEIKKGVARKHGKGPGVRVYTRDENPTRFWAHAGGFIIVGGVFLFKGIGGVLSKEN